MEELTCGKGLAEHSVLPAKLGELLAFLAENLEVHMETLDLKDQSAGQEHDAYLKLARAYRQIAAQLEMTAGQMAAYRDLPMGRHDEKALSAPKVLQAFEKLVKTKQELLTLLQEQAEQDQVMLVAMRSPSGGPPMMD